MAAERGYEALHIARMQLHPLDESQALESLAILAAEDGDHQRATGLLGELLAVIERCPPVAELATRVSIARIALMVGDDNLALKQLAFFDGITLTLHGRCDVMAARVLAASIRGKRCDEGELLELMALNDRLHGRPGQEAATVSIALALALRGRIDEAIRNVAEYVHRSRRERWPSRHPLLVALSQDRPAFDSADGLIALLRAAAPQTVGRSSAL